jgi:SdpC family antimicrobial peptide
LSGHAIVVSRVLKEVVAMWFRSRLKSVIAVVVGSASLAYGLGPSVAWASGGSATASAASNRLPAYSGETLFRGLFFHQGPIGQRLPGLSISPTAPTGQGALVLDALIAKMRQSDPAFFNRFATGIQSGSRLRILAAIKDAQAVFDNAVVAVYHARAVSNGKQIGYCLYGVVALAVALVLVVVGAGVVVVAAVAAAVVVWVWFWAPASDPASRLAQEKWVNRIALSPLAATA